MKRKIIPIAAAAALAAGVCGSLTVSAGEMSPRALYIKTQYVPEEADEFAEEQFGTAPRSLFGENCGKLSLGHGYRQTVLPYQSSDLDLCVCYPVFNGDELVGGITVFSLKDSGEFSVQMSGRGTVEKALDTVETSPDSPAVIVCGDNATYAVTPDDVTVLMYSCGSHSISLENEIELLYGMNAEDFFPDGEFTETVELSCAKELEITEGKAKRLSFSDNDITNLISDDPSVASVSKNGKIRGISAGSCHIAVKSPDKKRYIKVNVETNKIIPDKSYLKLGKGKTEVIDIDLKINDAVFITETADTLYKGGGAAAEAVLKNGRLTVTGISEGTDIITVYSKSDSSVRRRIVVDVVPQE